MVNGLAAAATPSLNKEVKHRSHDEADPIDATVDC
jgi:hypothetical protein